MPTLCDTSEQNKQLRKTKKRIHFNSQATIYAGITIFTGWELINIKSTRARFWRFKWAWGGTLKSFHKYMALHRTHIYIQLHTVERVLIAWFNDYVIGYSGQIANQTIVIVDPVLYTIQYPQSYFVSLMIASPMQFAVIRTSQYKTRPTVLYL